MTGQQSLDLPTDDPDTAHHTRPPSAHQSTHHAPHINTNVSHTTSHITASNGSYMASGGRQRSGTTNSAASSSRVDPTSATAAHRPDTEFVGSYTSSGLSTAVSGGVASHAGFGIFHRSETPEPWEKRLTDDGQAYYYVNPITEESRWTRPEPMEYSSGPKPQPAQHAQQTSGIAQQQSLQGHAQYGYGLYSQPKLHGPHTRNRTDSEASFSGREGDTRRASVYSDDSEVSPLGKEPRHGLPHATESSNLMNAATTVRPWPTPGGGDSQMGGMANPLQIAMTLQEQVKPPPLPPLTVYSELACEAIGAVVEAYSESNNAAANATDGTKADISGANDGDASTGTPSNTDPNTRAALTGATTRASTDTARIQTMADRVALVVIAVRNLLYVSGTLTGTLPNLGGSGATNGSLNGGLGGLNGVGAGLTEDVDWVRQEIKPFQRKVTATLSKLVLSARAVNANPDWPIAGTANSMGRNARVESDAAELERAVTTFVYQIQRTAASSRAKRLHGTMLPGEGPSGIGPGLIGAGVAGGWKGSGFVPISESSLTGGPERRLGREVVAELANLRLASEERMMSLRSAIEAYKTALATSKSSGANANVFYDSRPADLVILNGRLVVAHITDFLLHAEDIHIAVGVDVMGTAEDDEAYITGVKRARELIRTLETAKQAIYDDGSVLLMASQAIHVSSLGALASPSASTSNGPADVLLLAAIPALQSNLGTVMEALELLLDIAHKQDEVQLVRDGQHIGYADEMEYPHNRDYYRQMSMRPQLSSAYNDYSDADTVLDRIGLSSSDLAHPKEQDVVSIGDVLTQRGAAPRGQGPRDVYQHPPVAQVRESMDGSIAPSDVTDATAVPGGSTLSTSTDPSAGSTVGPGDGDDTDSDLGIDAPSA